MGFLLLRLSANKILRFCAFSRNRNAWLCANPLRSQRRQEILAGWKKDIAEMAKCPNVNVKLGGVGMTSFG